MAIVNLTASATQFSSAILVAEFHSTKIALGNYYIPEEYWYVGDNSLTFVFGQPGVDFEILQASVSQNTYANAIITPHGAFYVEAIQYSSALATLQRLEPAFAASIQQNTSVSARIVLIGGELLADTVHNTSTSTKLSTEGSLPTTHITQHSSSFSRIFTGAQLVVDAYQHTLALGSLESHLINVYSNISHETYAAAVINFNWVLEGIASEASQVQANLFTEKNIVADIVNYTTGGATLFDFIPVETIIYQDSKQQSKIVFAGTLYGTPIHYSTVVATIDERTRLHVHPSHRSYATSAIRLITRLRIDALHNTYSDTVVHVVGDAKSAVEYVSQVPYAWLTKEGHAFVKSLDTRQRTKVVRAYLIPRSVPKKYLKINLIQEFKQESYLSIATEDLLAYNIQLTGTKAYIWTGYHRLLGNLVQESITFVVPTKILKKIIVKPRLIYYGEPYLHFVFYDDE